jgi:hypothetical protein
MPTSRVESVKIIEELNQFKPSPPKVNSVRIIEELNQPYSEEKVNPPVLSQYST